MRCLVVPLLISQLGGILKLSRVRFHTFDVKLVTIRGKEFGANGGDSGGSSGDMGGSCEDGQNVQYDKIQHYGYARGSL